jgi:hypothetical protein
MRSSGLVSHVPSRVPAANGAFELGGAGARWVVGISTYSRMPALAMAGGAKHEARSKRWQKQK